MRVRVYYEDTDIGGVVYYANYFKFIERARSEPFFALNVTPYDANGHFVVTNLAAKFLSSAKLGDELEIKTAVKEISKIRVVLAQSVLRNDEIIFMCDVTLAYVNSGLKPSKIPQNTLEVLNSYR